MRIIRTTPESNGAYPALQEWAGRFPPAGYAEWPDKLSTEDFDAHNGFVILKLARGCVVSYEINTEAWEAWTPAPEPEPPSPGGEYVTYDELAKAIREGVNSI